MCVVPFINLVVGLQTQRYFSHSKSDRVKQKVHVRKRTVQSFHSRPGGGITVCDMTLTNYCTCPLFFKRDKGGNSFDNVYKTIH